MKLIFHQVSKHYPYVFKGLVTIKEGTFNRKIYVRYECYMKDRLIYKDVVPFKKFFFPIWTKDQKKNRLNKAAWHPNVLNVWQELYEKHKQIC